MRRLTDLAHDASLALWLALAVARAAGLGRAGPAVAAVVGVNLAAGTPLAVRRLRERRTDPAALLAPVAVLVAMETTARGGWSPVAATAALHVLRQVDRRRSSSRSAHG